MVTMLKFISSVHHGQSALSCPEWHKTNISGRAKNKKEWTKGMKYFTTKSRFLNNSYFHPLQTKKYYLVKWTWLKRFYFWDQGIKPNLNGESEEEDFSMAKHFPRHFSTFYYFKHLCQTISMGPPVGVLDGRVYLKVMLILLMRPGSQFFVCFVLFLQG